MLPSVDRHLWLSVCECVCTCLCSLGPDKWAAVAPAFPEPSDLCLRERERETFRLITALCGGKMCEYS